MERVSAFAWQPRLVPTYQVSSIYWMSCQLVFIRGLNDRLLPAPVMRDLGNTIVVKLRCEADYLTLVPVPVFLVGELRQVRPNRWLANSKLIDRPVLVGNVFQYQTSAV